MNIDLGYDYEIAELEEINNQSKLVSVDLKVLPRKPVLVTNLELALNPIVDSLIRIYEYKQYYIVNYKYDPKDVFNVSKYITEISSKTVVLQVDSSSPDNNDGIQEPCFCQLMMMLSFTKYSRITLSQRISRLY
ncbi:hypothetical protein HDV04_004544 [Boothiomyces sp. JEL0838]|nr:hypothetical protein HDV04_004544 [Boothiomyces sp. JEL0838]